MLVNFNSDLLDAIYDRASSLEYDVWMNVRVEITKSIDNNVEAIIIRQAKEYDFSK